MGARAIDIAVRPPNPSSGVRQRLADIRAVFPKPIRADGGRVRCRVQVPHRGRRLSVARAELYAPDGRLAVLVDATYIAEAPTSH